VGYSRWTMETMVACLARYYSVYSDTDARWDVDVVGVQAERHVHFVSVPVRKIDDTGWMRKLRFRMPARPFLAHRRVVAKAQEMIQVHATHIGCR
jgi:hypothetical protein